MSLTVPTELQEQAARGDVADEDFVACVRDSLPYAYTMIARLAGELSAGDREFVDNTVEPPDERARGQLLRALSSDAIRAALAQHFGVRLAFQNCHRVAVFRPGSETSATYREFVSVRSQLLNQTPELVNC